jgi:microcystin-dependent protein
MKPILTALILALCIGSLVHASDLFTYQGKLTDAQGTALPNGQYRIGVRVWENATPPAQNPQTEVPLWARKYDVPVQDGVFSLMIGATGVAWTHTPAALTESLKLAISSGNRFLDITIMSDANGAEKDAAQWQTLAPRQSLNAVPYAMNGVPTGTVVPHAGTTPPDGWVECNGGILPFGDPRYARLHATITTSYNLGDEPIGYFRLPDLRGRAAIGRGRGDTWVPGGLNQSTTWVLGQKFGAEKHRMTVAEMPSHTHIDEGHIHDTTIPARGSGANAFTTDSGPGNGTTFKTALSKAKILNEGNDQPHNNMQPSLVLNFIIKL